MAKKYKEISGIGPRRSREKGNQGVGDFSFINILQPFLFIFLLNYFTFYIFFCIILTYRLLTIFTHTYSHDPRHLATS